MHSGSSFVFISVAGHVSPLCRHPILVYWWSLLSRGHFLHLFGITIGRLQKQGVSSPSFTRIIVLSVPRVGYSIILRQLCITKSQYFTSCCALWSIKLYTSRGLISFWFYSDLVPCLFVTGYGSCKWNGFHARWTTEVDFQVDRLPAASGCLFSCCQNKLS